MLEVTQRLYGLHGQLASRSFSRVEKRWHEEKALDLVRLLLDVRECGPVAVLRDRLGLDSLRRPEHADHPDYKCTLEARYRNDVPDFRWADAEPTPESLRRGYERHDLIYTDGCIAVTLHEHCYAFWMARSGHVLGGSLWGNKLHQLTPESIETLKKYGRPR